MIRDEKWRQKKLAKKTAKRKTKLGGRRHEPRARGSEPHLVVSYEITDEPMPDLAYQRLPDAIQDQLETLYHKVLLQRPNKALAVLKPLIEQYPDVPQLYNYLYIAYRGLRDRANAQRVLHETRVRFPHYLFGRIAYASDCLQRGEAEKVPEIFEDKYELKLLYPGRKRFHLSEVLGFYSVMAWYFHVQGESALAERYYKLMRQLDPEHRSTRSVKRMLYPSRLSKLVRRLLTRDV